MDEHETTRTNLAALAAGLLSTADEKMARAHLGTCDVCRRELESYQRMIQGLADLPAAAPSPFRVARIATLAVERRKELLAKRRNAVVLVGLAVFSWLLFLGSLPLLSMLTHWLEAWFGISHLPALAVGIAFWWGSCFLIGMSLVPLLREHGAEWKERRI